MVIRAQLAILLLVGIAFSAQAGKCVCRGKVKKSGDICYMSADCVQETELRKSSTDDCSDIDTRHMVCYQWKSGVFGIPFKLGAVGAYCAGGTEPAGDVSISIKCEPKND